MAGPYPALVQPVCIVMQHGGYHRRMITVGILGASGYAGSELLRLLAAHPELEVRLAGADSQAGPLVADLYPNLAPAYPALRFTPATADAREGPDLVFLGLPPRLSHENRPHHVGRVK